MYRNMQDIKVAGIALCMLCCKVPSLSEHGQLSHQDRMMTYKFACLVNMACIAMHVAGKGESTESWGLTPIGTMSTLSQLCRALPTKAPVTKPAAVMPPARAAKVLLLAKQCALQTQWLCKYLAASMYC